MPLRRLAILALVLASVGALVWALRSEPIEPLDYLPARSPMVVCDQVEDPEKMQPGAPPMQRSHWLSTLPIPVPPKGSFASSMQPRVFRELGFLGGTRVCAAPIVPTVEQIEAQAAAAGEVAVADAALQRLLGSCGCTILKETGRIASAPRCLSKMPRENCPNREALSADIDAALATLDEALARARPRLHWRVVGTLGRPGRFAVMAAERLEWLEFPGRVSTAASIAAGDADDPVVTELLAQPGTVAVIRQARGRAVLVVRELGDALVFDYFEQLADPQRWGGDWSQVGADFRGARLQAALALPGDGQPADSMFTQLRDLPGSIVSRLPEAKGAIHLDHARLDDLELLMLAARRMSGFNYDASAQVYELEPVVAETWTVLWDDAATYARVGLSLEGQSWWASQDPGETLVQHVSARLQERPDYRFEPAARHEFMLRGTALERGLFDAVRGFGRVVDAVFSLDASAVEGNAAQFRIRLPAGRVAGDLATAEGLAPLQAYLSTNAHELQGQVDVNAGYALLELRELAAD